MACWVLSTPSGDKGGNAELLNPAAAAAASLTASACWLLAVNRLAERVRRIVSSDFYTASPVEPAASQAKGTAPEDSSRAQPDLLSDITTPNPLAELTSSRPQPNGYPSTADSQSNLQQVDFS